MNRAELFVGQPVMTPDNRHKMTQSTVTKIGRLWVYVNDGYRYGLDDQQRDGFTGRFYTLDQWVDALDRAQNVKALRLYGVEVDSRRLANAWSNAQIKALASAVATIRETVNERDR